MCDATCSSSRVLPSQTEFLAAFTSGCPFDPDVTFEQNARDLLATARNDPDHVYRPVEDTAAFSDLARKLDSSGIVTTSMLSTLHAMYQGTRHTGRHRQTAASILQTTASDDSADESLAGDEATPGAGPPAPDVSQLVETVRNVRNARVPRTGRNARPRSVSASSASMDESFARIADSMAQRAEDARSELQLELKRVELEARTVDLEERKRRAHQAEVLEELEFRIKKKKLEQQLQDSELP